MTLRGWKASVERYQIILQLDYKERVKSKAVDIKLCRRWENYRFGSSSYKKCRPSVDC